MVTLLLLALGNIARRIAEFCDGELERRALIVPKETFLERVIRTWRLSVKVRN